jgi:nucleoside 2-deoxyribosyltransferase
MTDQQEKCFFCDNVCKDFNRAAMYSSNHYLCEFCGDYLLFDAAKKVALESKHIIAGYLYEVNRAKSIDIKPFELSNATIELLLKDERIPQTQMQRLEKFLVKLYKSDSRIGKQYVWSSDVIEDYNSLIPISYSKDIEELRGMFEALAELNYMTRTPIAEGTYDNRTFTISPKGYERAEQLISTNIDSTSVFVAMDYNDAHVAEAFDNAIKPACEICGFNETIIRDKQHNNGITDEIIVEIKKSKFVIADFTFNNLGAYWEAGFAQGLDRSVIRCCKEEWFNEHGLHFDIKHYRTIIWKDSEHLIKELKANIRANFTDAKLED